MRTIRKTHAHAKNTALVARQRTHDGAGMRLRVAFLPGDAAGRLRIQLNAQNTMTNADKLRLLAKDLTKEFPRSPRELLAGYVIAGRAVDKCRSVLVGCAGEYHSNCPVDNIFLDFAGIPYDSFRDFVATGATDAEVADWIKANAKQRERIEVIRWNNEWRDKHLSELPDGIQEYMEDYVPQFVPRNRPVHHFFDVYDLEEERI